MAAPARENPRPYLRVARPRGLHAGKTRDQVADQMRALDSWRRLLPDIHRLSSGCSQEALLWSIYNRTIAGTFDPSTRTWLPTSHTPVMYPEDYAKETGFTHQQHAGDIENGMKRGLIEAKCACGKDATCGPAHYQHALRLEKWPQMPNFRATAGFARKQPASEGLEGEEKANTRARRLASVHPCLVKEVPLAAGGTAQLGSIEWRNGKAAHTVNTSIECVNHLFSDVRITPCDAGGGVIRIGLEPGVDAARTAGQAYSEDKAKGEEKANTRARRLEREKARDTLVSGLVGHGFPSGPARADLLLEKLCDTPLDFFFGRLHQRNFLLGGRPKPAEKRLPPGALPQFASQVRQEYEVQLRVAARVDAARQPGPQQRTEEGMCANSARATLANPAATAAARLDARAFLAMVGEYVP